MIDLILVVLLAVNVLLGFRFGFFRRILQFGGFYVGLFLAVNASPGLVKLLGYNTGAHPSDSHFAVFLLMLIVIVVIVEILGAAFGDALGFLNALVFDRFFGAIAGFVFISLELAIVLYLFQNLMTTASPAGTGHLSIVTTASEQMPQSYVARGLEGIRPAATFVFLPALPGEPALYFAQTYS